MVAASLRPDCEQCAALCCVAFEFEKSADFGEDKPAGTPCSNLGSGGRCGIYGQRRHYGFGGCIQYDCLGAGQRVVQQTFAGRTWMEEPALLAPMLRAFEHMRQVQEGLSLLATAEKADLLAGDRQELQRLVSELEAIADAVLQPSASMRLNEVDGEIRAFLTGLRRYFKDLALATGRL